MRNMHRAYYNLDFMFATFFFSEEQLQDDEGLLAVRDSTMCPDCGKSFKSPYYAISHRESVHGQRLLECSMCLKKFRGKINFEAHQRRYHRALEKCNDCGKFYKNVAQHIMTKHTREEDKKYVCHVCGKGFNHKDKYAGHQKIHRKFKVQEISI